MTFTCKPMSEQAQRLTAISACVKTSRDGFNAQGRLESHQGSVRP